MKHNWVYKRLGDVCEFERGITYDKSEESSDVTSVALLRSNNITLESSKLNFNELKYLKETFEIQPKKKLSKYSILICMSNGSLDHLGKTAYIDRDYNLGFGGFMGLIKPHNIVSKYIFFIFQSTIFKEFLATINRGANIRNLQFTKLSSIRIPVPPMEVQEQIVAELDKINELIEQNRELLRQFDSLAQSLFYDTFGDPVTNPKGWELHPFSDVFKLNSGDGLSAKQIIPGQYPVYGGNGIVGYHQNYNVDGNNVIIGRVGALCGNVRNVKNKAFVTDNAFIVTQLKALNQHYTTFMLNILNLRQYAKAVAQPVISNVGLKKILIQVPPLAMQEQFAAKVEAIEAHKATVDKSIAELQTLLDSRMDYWFN